MIYNNEDHFLVYEEVSKEPVELFLKNAEGKAKLIHYVKHILDKCDEMVDSN